MAQKTTNSEGTIQHLLLLVKEASITDKNVGNLLQKIRSDFMKTRGGVQYLLKLGCVPCILKLLYRYTCMDVQETEAERRESEAKINIVLSIVSNLLTEKEARQQVRRDGIETIVTLLNDCTSEEVKIRCCRSLSNLAMDLPARPIIALAKGVQALVKVLEIRYVEVETPRAPKSGSEATRSADSDDVDIEPMFPSAALVEMACKALRILILDYKVRQQFVEEGVVARLAMLMKSEDPKLVAFVLRALSTLWINMKGRITEKMASEFSRAGVMPKVLELVDAENDKISQQAFSLLLPLAAHPPSAALIGASNGVEFFLSHLDSPRKHLAQKHLINGMCLLAKEGVNRFKLHESDGLKVFLRALQDDALVDVQDRVISSLVSFLYDDSSLTFMLEHGLVGILLSHLQRCGNFTSDFEVNIYKRAQALFKTVVKSCTEMEALKEGGTSDPSLERRVLGSNNTGNNSLDDDSNSGLQRAYSDSVCIGSASTSQPEIFRTIGTADHHFSSHQGVEQELKQQRQIPQTAMEGEGDGESICEEGEGNDGEVSKEGKRQGKDEPEPAQTRMYSMNSPTYQAETTWRMEDYHPGVTCKTYAPLSPESSFTVSEDSRTLSHKPYSPLSVQSYSSPPQSGSVSPRSSLTSSPPYSCATLSPVLSPCLSEGCSSLCSSERANSEDLGAVGPLSPGHAHQQHPAMPLIDTAVSHALVFSSSEEEDFAEDAQPGSSKERTNDAIAENSMESVSKVLFHLGEDDTGMDQGSPEGKNIFSNHIPGDSQDICDLFSVSEVPPTWSFQTGERFFRQQDSHAEPTAKKPKLSQEAGVHALVTQDSILILLSRLSVRDDLSHYLAKNQVILCLTDHLALADEPHERCERILSRIMASPHCLTSLLKMCAPALLVRTLMLDSDLKLQEGAFGHAGSGTSGSLMSRHLSMERKTARSSLGSEVCPESSPAVKQTASRASFAQISFPAEATKTHCDRQFSFESSKSDQQDASEGRSGKGSCVDLARTGSKLLESLSGQAVSPYGEGVILYTFSRLSAADKLMCATSLLFLHLHWSQARRREFLLQQTALETVLSGLCSPPSTDTTGTIWIKDVLGLALVYLSHGLHLTPRFKRSDVPWLLNQAVQNLGLEMPAAQDSAATSQESDSSGSSVQGQDCSYNQAEKDLRIMVRRGRSSHVLYARRETLVRNSSVFAAMLQGSYIESSQSEILVNDVCFKAMTTVLHYLHCCNGQCSELKSLGSYDDWVCRQKTTQPDQADHNAENATMKKKWLKHVLNVIAVADRYLLPELVRYLCAILSTSLTDQRSAEQVFQFASFHGLLELAEDCLRFILSSPSSVPEATGSVTALAEGQFGSVFRTAALSLLKRGIASTP